MYICFFLVPPTPPLKTPNWGKLSESYQAPPLKKVKRKQKKKYYVIVYIYLTKCPGYAVLTMILLYGTRGKLLQILQALALLPVSVYALYMFRLRLINDTSRINPNE